MARDFYNSNQNCKYCGAEIFVGDDSVARDRDYNLHECVSPFSKSIIDNFTSERHPNSARFHEILTELGALHDKKQKDYGRGDDPFANVRSSSDWGMPAWVGAMVRAGDKIKRLQNFARNGVLANESAEDSFRDLAVYAVIGLVLYEQESKK